MEGENLKGFEEVLSVGVVSRVRNYTNSFLLLIGTVSRELFSFSGLIRPKLGAAEWFYIFLIFQSTVKNVKSFNLRCKNRMGDFISVWPPACLLSRRGSLKKSSLLTL